MKRFILLLIITMVFLPVEKARSQWIVHDPVNYATNFNDYLQTIQQYQQMLQDAQEFITQSEMLKKVFDDGGMWEETYKTIQGIHSLLNDVRSVVSAVQAKDAYALIEHLPVDDAWKDRVKSVIEEVHGNLPDPVFDRLVGVVASDRPELAQILILSRNNQQALINHRLNSFYYLSSRKEMIEKREEMIESQRNTISGFGDQSQGQSTVMINSQLSLVNQQNEEIIRALNHMIMTQNDDFFDKQKIKDASNQAIINDHFTKQSLNPDDFRGFDF